jgi:hypothetical protein
VTLDTRSGLASVDVAGGKATILQLGAEQQHALDASPRAADNPVMVFLTRSRLLGENRLPMEARP